MSVDEFTNNHLGGRISYVAANGFQCVDLAKAYMNECFGVPIGAYGDAIDYWYSTNGIILDYFYKVENTPDAIAEKGDIVIFNAVPGNQCGHIGVSLGGDVNTFTLLEQNGGYGNAQGIGLDAVRTRIIDYSHVAGMLRPKNSPTPPQIEANQRAVGADGANYRAEPNKDSTQIGEFFSGDVLNFKGFVRGQDPYGNGNNIWFVGAFSGGYIYSGSCTDSSTNGLPDITPVPIPEPTPQPLPNPTISTLDKVIDVSAHNGITDYNTVKNNVRGVIAKAGHTGKSYGGTPLNGDPKFADYKSNFGDKLVGSYWYAYCSLDPKTEASNFVKAVGNVPKSFTYWLDIEETDGVADVNTWCQTFLNEVDKQTSRVTGLYMNRNWFDSYITSETKGNRPIWLAHYGTEPMSNPAANQVAHQYTSSGRVTGYDGNLDMNAVTEQFFVPTEIKPVEQPKPEEPTKPQPPIETPPEVPQNISESLLEVIKQFINKIISWLSSWKRDKK